jgi:hypothetical protein
MERQVAPPATASTCNDSDCDRCTVVGRAVAETFPSGTNPIVITAGLARNRINGLAEDPNDRKMDWQPDVQAVSTSIWSTRLMTVYKSRSCNINNKSVVPYYSKYYPTT